MQMTASSTAGAIVQASLDRRVAVGLRRQVLGVVVVGVDPVLDGDEDGPAAHQDEDDAHDRPDERHQVVDRLRPGAGGFEGVERLVVGTPCGEESQKADGRRLPDTTAQPTP